MIYVAPHSVREALDMLADLASIDANAEEVHQIGTILVPAREQLANLEEQLEALREALRKVENLEQQEGSLIALVDYARTTAREALNPAKGPR